MRGLFAAALVTMLGIFASASTAHAQGGSAGGVIGKSDKSVSGSESAPASRAPAPAPARKPAPSKAPAAPAEPAKLKAAGCGRAVGTWFWVTEVVTIKADGSITAKGGPGYWKCTDGLLHVYWPGFIVPHEIFSISNDGNRLISQNTSSAPKRLQ